MNSLLTEKLKNKCLELGADIAGVGNIERWSNCPVLMSPKGIMPSGRSVIVFGMHFLDGMVETSGEWRESEKGQHYIAREEGGTYASQTLLNNHLDNIAYNIMRDLEDSGYMAIPIAASNIWRYRPYKELTNCFTPDMSNIYSPVAAGIAEMGISGNCLSPEVGPRCRYNSVITDAVLTPTPLMPGNTLCDNCNLCVKYCTEHCAASLSKEIKGTTSLQIEGKEYPFLDKNLWRCSWAEHFTFNMDNPIPEIIDDKVIINSTCSHISHMPSPCIKYCLPKKVRSWDKKNTAGPKRKRSVLPNREYVSKELQNRIVSKAISEGVDAVIIKDLQVWKNMGIEEDHTFTTAKTMTVFALKTWMDIPEETDKKLKISDFGKINNFDLTNRTAHVYTAEKINYFFSRELEKNGYIAAPYTAWRQNTKLNDYLAKHLGWKPAMVVFMLSDAPLDPVDIKIEESPLGISAEKVNSTILKNIVGNDIDLLGVSSAKTIHDLTAQLKKIYEGEQLFIAKDKAVFLDEYEPEITEMKKTVLSPFDYMEKAKSVIILGIRIPEASAKRAGEPPAEAVGPYAFSQYQSYDMLRMSARKLIRELSLLGHNAVASYDLTGTASMVATARGEFPDAFCNRFSALCAGLGTIGKGGFLLTPEFGSDVRFIAIITDMKLDSNAINSFDDLRQVCDSGCDKCITSCCVSAHQEQVSIVFNDKELSFIKINQAKCDWAKRYALMGEEGYKYLGSEVNEYPPAKINAENLANALKKHDPMLKTRLSSMEKCVISCPVRQGKMAK
jgi:epoxyqueuosine reductase QueG